MSLIERIAITALSAIDDALARRYSAPTQDIAVPGPWTDRDNDVLGVTVTPEVLAYIIQRRNRGELRQWCDLADHARRTNPHLHSQLQVRELSVQETDFEVVPGDTTARAKKAAKVCEDLFRFWQEEGWYTWASDIVGAKYYPVGLQEVGWGRWDGLMAPLSLTRVAERRLSYACNRFDETPWELRIWDQNAPESIFNPVYGLKVSDFHPDKFIVHEPRVVGGHRASEGLFAVVCWYWLFGVYSWKHLMALLETFGRPPVIGYFAAGGAKAADRGGGVKMDGARNATDSEIAAAKRVLATMSGALRAVVPDTIRYEVLKFDMPANPAQILTSDKVDAYISKAINGTTGVTDIVAGARSAHETAAEQALTPYRADCRDVARVGSILFRRFVRANPDYFGVTCAPPRMVATQDEVMDLQVFTTAMQTARRTGARIPEAWYHERLGVPTPKPGERLLGDAVEGAQSDGAAAKQGDTKPDDARVETRSIP